eukprot:Nk52_evm91s221 gene=Nk52_evmTU91s221
MSQLQLNSLLLDALISTDHIQHAALVRRKDFSLRASTPGFVPRSLEISHIANGFKDSQTLRSTGFTFQERRYKCIRADASAVYGKDGKRGIIAVATPNLIVIGTYDSHMYPSVAAEAIEKLVLIGVLGSQRCNVVEGTELVVQMQAHDTECFYETFAVNDDVTFEYQVVFGGRLDIDVQIHDPQGTILHQEQRKQYDSQRFKIAIAGDYKFCFDNEFSTFTQKTVYFDLFKGEGEDALTNAIPEQITALTRLEQYSHTIHRNLMEITDYQTHHRLREATGRSLAEEVNTRVMVWSAAQSALMVGVSLVQVYILKSFFGDDVRYGSGHHKYRPV